MLRFGKSTEYALLSLVYITQAPRQIASAAEIARAYGLPSVLLGKILKSMQGNGLLQSERGARGGYRVVVDLSSVSLERLMVAVPGSGLGGRQVGEDSNAERLKPTRPILMALRQSLLELLRGIRLSDLVVPGRRIDVPAELVGLPGRAGRGMTAGARGA